MTQETRNKSQELTGFIDTVLTSVKGILLLRYFLFFSEFRRVFPSALAELCEVLRFAQGVHVDSFFNGATEVFTLLSAS